MTDPTLPDDAEPADHTSARQEIVPAFTPVPRLKDRSNGWRPEVQRAFIEALAETGSVKSACRAVGRADHGAYLLRRHPEATEFRRAWDAALDIAMRRIEDVAMDRALNGVAQPLYYHGEIFGERTVYNDRLLMFMLRNRAPHRFGGALTSSGGGDSGGARGDNAIDQMKLTRLRKRWRKEWEAEQTVEEVRDARAVTDSIDTKLDAMRRNWLQGMSPHVRSLYLAFQQAEMDQDRRAPSDDLPLLPGVPWPETERGEIDEAEWEDAYELKDRGIEPRVRRV